MSNKLYQKYKDRNPLHTIHIISSFLLANGLLPLEKWVSNSSEFYSVSLSIANHSFHVNGKGTSQEFALASAYGEFMERFQNMVFLRIHSKALYEFPKIGINLDNTSENQETCILNLQNAIRQHSNSNLPVESLKKYLNIKNQIILKCCEFEDITTHSKLLIPYDLLDYYYGTNGMVAGNTEDEAYVEGLSEILERFVIKQFIDNKWTPPLLTDDLLKQLENYKKISQYIKLLESSGNYKVELRDLSMGLDIPAIGLILYRFSPPSYIVKVGVHPILELAAERCFTELLQGQNIDQYINMIPLSKTVSELQKDINLHNIFVNGYGAFPLSFFSEIGSFSSVKAKKNFESNEQMKLYLISLITRLGYSIYIHNSTNSQIISYQFVIPGMSENISLSKKILDNLIEDLQMSDLIKSGLNSIDSTHARCLRDYLDICGLDLKMPVGALIMDLSLSPTSIYNKISLLNLKFRLSLFIGDYSTALETVQQINKNFSQKGQSNLFYRCYEDFLSLHNLDNPDNIKSMLYRFYPAKIVRQVCDTPAIHLFADFHEIKCDFDCSKCSCSNECITKNDISTYRNFINQNLNTNILKG